MAGEAGAGIPVPILSGDAPGQPVPLAVSPEEKKKRVRRTKAELAAARAKEAGELVPPTDGPSPEDMKRATDALAMTFAAVGAILADRRGEHWRMKDEECQTLAGPWAAVLAPYLPRVGAAMPLVSALVITWTVVQPRITEDRRQAARRAAEAGPALVTDAAP